MELDDFKKLKPKGMVDEYTKLLDKAANLEEENKLLIEQTIQDEKVLIEEVKPDKKPSDMGEFELADYMRRKTSKKIF